jgi:hypothetical protein
MDDQLPTGREEMEAILWTFGEILCGAMETQLNHAMRTRADLVASMPIKTFQCGTGEMGTLYWSKDADLDKLSNMHPAPIDPEVDRIDFYIKSSSGEYIPWKPAERQLQMLSAMGLPTLLAGKGEANRQSPPETDSSTQTPTDTGL